MATAHPDAGAIAATVLTGAIVTVTVTTAATEMPAVMTRQSKIMQNPKRKKAKLLSCITAMKILNLRQQLQMLLQITPNRKEKQPGGENLSKVKPY